MNEENEILNQLKLDWDLQTNEFLSQEQIISLLSQRIIYFLEKGPETFFQLMYRLDISEKKLNAVLNSPDPAQQIAKLVYERQLQKIKSRKENKGNANEKDPDLDW